jgi:hypothetical protein
LEYIAKQRPEVKVNADVEIQKGNEEGDDKIPQQKEPVEIQKGSRRGDYGILRQEKTVVEQEKTVKTEIQKDSETRKKELEAKMDNLEKMAQLDNVNPTDEQQRQAKALIADKLDTNETLQENPALKERYINLLATHLAYQSPKNIHATHRLEFNAEIQEVSRDLGLEALFRNIDNQFNIPDSSAKSYDTKHSQEMKAEVFNTSHLGNDTFKQQLDNNLKDSAHLNAFAKTEGLQDTLKDFTTLYSFYNEHKESVYDIARQKKVPIESVQNLFMQVEAELNENKYDTENQKALFDILQTIDHIYTTETRKEVEKTLLLAMVG